MNSIHEYVLDRKGNRIGCILAVGDETGKFALSWSLCNVNAGDTFNKKLAVTIAKNRAETNYHNTTRGLIQALDANTKYVAYNNIPVSIRSQYKQMEQRCTKYFQRNHTTSPRDHYTPEF